MDDLWADVSLGCTEVSENDIQSIPICLTREKVEVLILKLGSNRFCALGGSGSLAFIGFQPRFDDIGVRASVARQHQKTKAQFAKMIAPHVPGVGTIAASLRLSPSRAEVCSCPSTCMMFVISLPR